MPAQSEVATGRATAAPLNFFERHLTPWIALSIVAGIVIGQLAAVSVRAIGGMLICVMIIPMLLKLDFAGGSGFARVGAMIEPQLDRIAACQSSNPSLSCTLAAVEIAPDFAASKACRNLSVVAPVKTRPPAVAIEPPRLGAPSGPSSDEMCRPYRGPFIGASISG